MTGIGVGLAARLARREVRHRPGRTALVVALVAVPVAAMTMAVVLVRTEPVTALEQWEAANGQADAVRYLERRELGDLDRLDLPAGARTLVVRDAWELVRLGDGRWSEVQLTDAPLDDPVTDGIHELVAGRAPGADGEVALSRTAADRLSLTIGETVATTRPEGTWTVVGLVEQWHCLTCAVAVVAPGADWPVPDDRGTTRLLVDVPGDPAATDVADLGRDGAFAVRGVAIAHGDPTDRDGSVRWALVLGAVALTVAGIVISAAFAIGARRQLVTIGQLAASGAAPATVRAALVLQGTFTGVVGTLTGLTLGGGLLAAGRDWVERAVDHRIGPWVGQPADVLAVAAVGVVAATVAALLPARTAARVPTLDALAGRRPLPPVPRRLTAGGLAAVATGLALLALAILGSRSHENGTVWALVAIAGGVTELLGACAVAPLLVSRLEPLAGRASGAWRLAARGLARQRTRSGGVLSAAAAAGALAVCASALVLGAEARYGERLEAADEIVLLAGAPLVFPTVTVPQPPNPSLRAAVADATGDDDPVTVRMLPAREPWTARQAGSDEWSEVLVGSGGGLDGPVVGDPAVLDAFEVPGDARDTLARDGLVVLAVEDGEPVVVAPPGAEPLRAEVVAADQLVAGSAVVVTERLAASLGLEPVAAVLAYVPPGGIDHEREGALVALRADIEHAGRDGFAASLWWSRPAGGEPVPLDLVLAGLALAFSLFVVGTGLALAAAESKDERDVLTVAGAPPATLARTAGAKAWLLSTLGALLAVPVGFLPVVVYSLASRGLVIPFPLVLPVRTILLLVLAAPAVAALASTVASAAAQRVRPVRVSTAAFE